MRSLLILACLFLFAAIADAQCSNGSCGAGSGNGLGLFRGRMAYADNSNYGPMISGYYAAPIGSCGVSAANGYITVNDLSPLPRTAGDVVQFVSGRWGKYTAGGWQYASDAEVKTAAACIAACACGCVETGSCLCKNCNTHTADPASPDYVPPTPKAKVSAATAPAAKDLTEVSIPDGYGLYQDAYGSLYLLKKDMMDNSAGLWKSSGQWVWKNN